MLGIAVDSEQRRVLAADSQDERLAVYLDLEVPVGDAAAERPDHELPARPDARGDLLRLHRAILDWRRWPFARSSSTSTGRSPRTSRSCSRSSRSFSAAGKPITEDEYYDQLAGLSDPEVVETWLGRPDPEVVAEKIRRYREPLRLTAHTVSPEARQAVREAATQVPLRSRLGIRADRDRARGRGGGPLGFDRGDRRGGRRRARQAGSGRLSTGSGASSGLQPDEAVAVEDSEVGIGAAKAAGVRCYAVSGTLPPEPDWPRRTRSSSDSIRTSCGECWRRLYPC